LHIDEVCSEVKQKKRNRNRRKTQPKNAKRSARAMVKIVQMITAEPKKKKSPILPCNIVTPAQTVMTARFTDKPLQVLLFVLRACHRFLQLFMNWRNYAAISAVRSLLPSYPLRLELKNMMRLHLPCLPS
jgi:hypothetical protein